MMGFLTSAYFIVPVSIAAIVIAVLLIKRVTKNLIHSKIVTSKLSGAALVYDILANEYSPSCVLKNVSLFKKESVSNSTFPVKAKSDIVLVGKGGVLLITVIDERGEFSNPKTGEWLQRIKNKQGDVEVVSKINPFDSTIPQMRLVAELLQGEGIFNKCVKRYVVFTQRNVKTVYKYPEVINIDQLLPTVRAINDNTALTGAEIRTAADLISDYSDFISGTK